MAAFDSTRWTPLGLAVLASFVSSGLARSQSLFRTLDGHRQWLGLERVESVGDLDGDGVPELSYSSGARGYRGVRNGATWQDLWGPVLDTPPDSLMSVVDARVVGDWNGDGAADIAYAYWDSNRRGRVVIRSSLDGSQLAAFERPTLVDFAKGGLTPAGDVNGDGLADLVVLSPPSRATVYAAPQGTLLHDVLGPGDVADAGPMGDLDGDGLDDIAVAWSSGFQLHLVSGLDGRPIGRLEDWRNSVSPRRDFWCVASLGDLTGDGVPDLAVGVLEFYCASCGDYRGYVEALDGASLETLWSTPCPLNLPPIPYATRFGVRLRSGADMNGDGVRDLWVQGVQGVSDFAAILSGRTGAMLYGIERSSLTATTGDTFTLITSQGGFVGDLDGDGLSEFVIVNYRADAAGQQSAGRAYVFRGAPGDASTTCVQGTHSAGGPGRLLVAGTITADRGTLPLRLLDCAPSGIALVFFGPAAGAGSSVPVGSGTLCIDPAGLHRIPTPVAIDAAGAGGLDAEWDAPPVAGLWVGGSTWTIQAGVRDTGDPLGAHATNALEVTFTR